MTKGKTLGSRLRISVLLGVVGMVACGGKAVIDEAGAAGTATTTTPTSTSTSSSSGTTTTTTPTTEPVCATVGEFCDCWVLQGCGSVGAGCLCHCDYECPNEPPCDCDCGGGDYLGCAPTTCPQLEFPPDAKLGFADDGCPYVLQ